MFVFSKSKSVFSLKKRKRERKEKREKKEQREQGKSIRGNKRGKGTIVSSIQERSIYGRYSKKKGRTGILGL